MIINAADLHLTRLVWKDMPSMAGDSFAAFDQIADAACTAPKGTSMLLSGDIFDKSKLDSETVERFRHTSDRIRECGVDMHVVQGQHEKAEPPWATALGAAKYIGHGEPVEINGFRVLAFDYMNSSVLQERLKSVKNVDILVLHQMARQAIDIEGAWDFDIDWIHKSVKLVLAGDYHGHLNVGRLWYPGATHFRKIDEVGPKYYLQINDDLSVTPVPLLTRPVLQVPIPTDKMLDEAVTSIMDSSFDVANHPDEIKQPLVVARYSPTVKDVVPRLEEACQKKDYLLRLKPLVGDAQRNEQEELPNAGTTLLECLDSLVSRERDAELYGFVAQLLSAPDARAVLEEKKQQLGIGG